MDRMVYKCTPFVGLFCVACRYWLSDICMCWPTKWECELIEIVVHRTLLHCMAFLHHWTTQCRTPFWCSLWNGISSSKYETTSSTTTTSGEQQQQTNKQQTIWTISSHWHGSSALGAVAGHRREILAAQVHQITIRCGLYQCPNGTLIQTEQSTNGEGTRHALRANMRCLGQIKLALIHYAQVV